MDLGEASKPVLRTIFGASRIGQRAMVTVDSAAAGEQGALTLPLLDHRRRRLAASFFPSYAGRRVSLPLAAGYSRGIQRLI